MGAFEHKYPPYAAFGARVLRLAQPNLQGSDVAVLQSVCNLMLAVMEPPLGPICGPLVVDGVFGQKTRRAVQSLQGYFGVPTSGQVGRQTYALFGQEGGARAPRGAARYGSRTLTPGMTGGDVRALQNRLNCFSYAAQLGRPADGHFDAATAAAVGRFKADAAAAGQSGLKPGAAFGQGAFDASWLYTFAGGRTLGLGVHGFDTVFLQAVLQHLGLYAGPLDGYFGDGTQSALRALQAQTGIRPDGAAGPETFRQIGLLTARGAPFPLPLIRV